MTSFAVLTPSRGLVHSRTIAAVEENIRSVGRCHYRGWFLSHDLPIPDCDEKVAELGLASGAEMLWFVEEDVIPPRGALVASMALLRRGFDVAAVDYPVGSAEDAWGCSVSDGDEVLWCGLGATLIARHVFERLPRPWFRTDVEYIKRGGAVWEARPNAAEPERRWGGQDIHFCMALRAAGMKIGLVPGMTASQVKVVTMGQPGTNHGWHTVEIHDRILKQYPGRG